MPMFQRPAGLRITAASALLALLAAACQPGAPAETTEQPAAESVASTTPASGEDVAAGPAPADLAAFRAGDLTRLVFDGGTELPPSSVLDAAGAEQSLSQFKGKVVVLNLWGEWCPPCVEEMPTLAGLQKAFPNGDVVVVPVAFGDAEARASAAAKLKSLTGETLPFFYDTDFNVSADVKTGAFPSTIFYGADGKEAARMLYPAKWDSEEAQGLVRAILARKG